MGKKDLASVTTDLSALASMMPTQRPVTPGATAGVSPALPAIAAAVAISSPATAEPAPVVPLRPKPVKREETIQFSLSLRKSLRKQLASLAADADMTMRAFVLNALKAKGLSVRDEDLADLRKERR
jgi:hypothetical protein